MPARPRLLDAFCGAGGSACGYVRAGFDVTGVDHRPQPRYLRSGATAFVQADALEYLAQHGGEFDAVHASPPCQAYSVARHIHKKSHSDLLGPTRTALVACGRPWVIENVPGAPMYHRILLCGAMFCGLRTYRHRWFETSFFMWQPDHPPHRVPSAWNGRQRKQQYEAGAFACIYGNVGTYCQGAMGIDWMTGRELSQAIPPAYTEFVGRLLLAIVEGA